MGIVGWIILIFLIPIDILLFVVLFKSAKLLLKELKEWEDDK